LSKRGVWHYERNDDQSKVSNGESYQKLTVDLLRKALAKFPKDPQKSLALQAVNKIAGDPPPPDCPRGSFGHSGIIAINVFYGRKKPVAMEQKNIANPEKLMKWLLDSNQALHKSHGTTINGDPENSSVLLGNPLHVFNLKPGSPFLRAM